MTEAELRAAHEHSSNHRDEIEASAVCGCFYCKSTFSPASITEWIGTSTARCPSCGIDSAIGDASGRDIGEPFLAEMRRLWF